MEPRFETKPGFAVVGMLIHTKPMSQEIPTLWQSFGPRMDEPAHQADPGVSIGLMGRYDDAMTRMDYMAGVAVTRVETPPSGMTTWDVSASTYAIFDTTLPNLNQTFDQIYNAWLPASGYRAADFCFERYGAEFNPGDPASLMSIYIPVISQA